MPKQIEYVKIDELIPLENNPKRHPPEQIRKLIKSLCEFGWTNPVLAIKHENKNLVIAGHARVEVAKKANISQIPVIFLDLPYEKAIAYNLADNKLAELAEWDDDKLAEILKGMDDDLRILTGFEEDEISELLRGINQQEGEDVIPEIPKEAKCKRGEIYLLKNHKLMCGDATTQ